MSNELFKLLACPFCKAGLEPKESALTCLECKRQYLVKHGVPIMLPDDVRAHAD